VLLLDAPLTFREFMSHEEVPLASIFREALELLATRPDAVLFGAQAVNAYCDPPRMTSDLDVLSLDPGGLAESLRATLSDRFRLAARVRVVEPAQSYRVDQIREPRNRQIAISPMSAPWSGEGHLGPARPAPPPAGLPGPA
jgi:hypothetical protein